MSVTCKVHWCELHKGYSCPCTCVPCTRTVEQARDAINEISDPTPEELQKADYPTICDKDSHNWPPDLGEDGAKCEDCGLPYDEFTEF